MDAGHQPGQAARPAPSARSRLSQGGSDQAAAPLRLPGGHVSECVGSSRVQGAALESDRPGVKAQLGRLLAGGPWPSSLTCLCSASSRVKSGTSVQLLWLLRGLNNILHLDLTWHYFLLFHFTLEFPVLPWFPDHLLGSLWRLVPAGLAGVRTPAQPSPQ